MKIIKSFIAISVVCIVICIILSNIGTTVRTNAEKIIYGTIVSDDCLLYDENYSPIILLPKSYYVKIENKIDDYYFVSYKDICGYVMADKIELTSTPEKPYQDDFVFNLKDDGKLYKSCTTKSSAIDITKNINLVYVGSIVGENTIEFGGNIWYYVKIENQNIYGYVYSYYTTGISGLTNSNENTTKLINSYSELKSMTKITLVIIIILLSIPMAIMTYILFTPELKIYKKEDFYNQ